MGTKTTIGKIGVGISILMPFISVILGIIGLLMKNDKDDENGKDWNQLAIVFGLVFGSFYLVIALKLIKYILGGIL